jgi:hypothetical protein
LDQRASPAPKKRRFDLHILACKSFERRKITVTNQYRTKYHTYQTLPAQKKVKNEQKKASPISGTTTQEATKDTNQFAGKTNRFRRRNCVSLTQLFVVAPLKYGTTLLKFIATISTITEMGV